MALLVIRFVWFLSCLLEVLSTVICDSLSEEGDKYNAIADPATLWDILKDDTQEVLRQNYEELKHWQPYGDVEDVWCILCI